MNGRCGRRAAALDMPAADKTSGARVDVRQQTRTARGHERVGNVRKEMAGLCDFRRRKHTTQMTRPDPATMADGMARTGLLIASLFPRGLGTGEGGGSKRLKGLKRAGAN